MHEKHTKPHLAPSHRPIPQSGNQAIPFQEPFQKATKGTLRTQPKNHRNERKRSDADSDLLAAIPNGTDRTCRTCRVCSAASGRAPGQATDHQSDTVRSEELKRLLLEVANSNSLGRRRCNSCENKPGGEHWGRSGNVMFVYLVA